MTRKKILGMLKKHSIAAEVREVRGKLRESDKQWFQLELSVPVGESNPELVTNGGTSRYSAGTQNGLSSAGLRALERRRRAQCHHGIALW